MLNIVWSIAKSSTSVTSYRSTLFMFLYWLKPGTKTHIVPPSRKSEELAKSLCKKPEQFLRRPSATTCNLSTMVVSLSYRRNVLRYPRVIEGKVEHFKHVFPYNSRCCFVITSRDLQTRFSANHVQILRWSLNTVRFILHMLLVI